MEPQQPSNDPSSSSPVQSSMQSPAANSQNISPAEKTTAVPSSWPGAFGIYKTSKEAVMLNISTVLFIILASIGMNIILSIFFKDEVAFIGDIASFIISTLLSAAGVLTYLACVRGQKLGFGEAVSKSVPFFVSMFALTVVTGLLLVFSFLLLIIPFFFVFPRLVLAPYFLIDQKLGFFQAIQTSWDKTKGHVGKVYGIIGANIAFALLCLTIVGIPFAIYFIVMYSAAYAVLMEFINKQTDSPATPLV